MPSKRAAFAAVATSILALFSGEALPSPLVGYSHVRLYDGTRRICAGLLLNSIVLSAAHCIRDAKDLRIVYAARGQSIFIAPALGTADRWEVSGSKRDLVALHVPVSEVADIDGRIEIDNQLTNFLEDEVDDFFLENKFDNAEPSSENTGNLQKIQLTRSPYNKLYTEFMLSSTKHIAIPKVDARGIASFSLSMRGPMSPEAADLICQGHSGTPVFGMRQGTKYLAGLVVKGRPSSYIDNRLCGTSFYAITFGRIAQEWIKSKID